MNGTEHHLAHLHRAHVVSIEIMRVVWDSAVSGSTHRFVLLALADFADDDGHCWPGHAALAARTGLGQATVKRAIRDLERDGLLRRTPHYESGVQTSNRYRLDVEAIRAVRAEDDTVADAAPEVPSAPRLALAPGSERPGGHTDPPVTHVQPPGHSEPPGGSQRPTDPPRDPSLDPSASSAAASIDVDAARMLAAALPRGIGRRDKADLAAQCREALADGASPDAVKAGLEAWAKRTGVSTKLLPSLISDAVKAANGATSGRGHLRAVAGDYVSARSGQFWQD